MDVAGFGKHVERRYHEFLDELRSYGDWAVQTAKENPLAAWLEPRLAMESLTESRTKGYKTSGATSSWMTAPKTAPKPLLRPRKSEAAGSTTSSPEVVDDQTKKMDEMAAMIHQLQEELSSLRPEPPRKQQAQADEESMTDRSFVNVTPRAQK